MMNRATKSDQPLLDQSKSLDASDPLRDFRNEFHVPQTAAKDEIYFVGNSLGLQPKITAEFVNEELEKWRTVGVRGHFESEFPWLPYHEFLTPMMARIVGGCDDEVVVMNSLTANLHFMMATFYRPVNNRKKILIEEHAFPSDHFAVESQIRLHGGEPAECLVLAKTHRDGLIDQHELEKQIRQQRDELAMILLPGVQYYTGQVFDMQRIAALANELEIPIGFDLAHAAGNIPLSLHDWNVDFAVWCSYKYLNSGPGSVGGCFLHRRHSRDPEKMRLAGWWGHDKDTRFKMKNQFVPIPTAEGWQVSNPPILSLAAIRASLSVFEKVGGMQPLREKSVHLTGFLEKCLYEEFGDQINIITPSETGQRGCQLSLELDFGEKTGRDAYEEIEAAGVRADRREPNVIRVAPVPLYNSYDDIARFVEVLKSVRG